MTHTPGPWKAAPPYSYGNKNWVVESANSKHGCVTIAETIYEVYGDQDDQEANARLMAAAPELLWALEAYVDYPDSPLSVRIEDIRAQARAAIAKATGVSEETLAAPQAGTAGRRD